MRGFVASVEPVLLGFDAMVDKNGEFLRILLDRKGAARCYPSIPADQRVTRMPGKQKKLIKPPSRWNLLFKRLEQARLDPRYVAKVALPDWWDDSIADTDAGYGRGLGLIASHLNISLADLWKDDQPLSCPDFGKTNYKKAVDVTEQEVEWAKCVALSAAKIALMAFDRDLAPLPSSGSAIRNTILQQGKTWVDLPSLLDFLWGHGIPVIHVSEFPRGTKKMAGLAARIDGRPVIVLSKNHPYSSLVVFDLAHEFGHIFCKHVDDDSVLVDTKINRIEEETDPEEKAANAVAVEILTGEPDMQFEHGRQKVTQQSLARMAMATAHKYGIEPGVVAQNFGFGRQFFPLANAACNILGDKNNPVSLLRKKMGEYLRLDHLCDEDREFLCRVTSYGVGNAVPLRH